MSKYNSRVAKEICSNVASGLSQKDSAILSGINEDTFYTWRKEKSEFSESLERAVIQYKESLVSKMNSFMFKDGKLALEVLARKWPNEFGRRDILPIPKEELHQKPLSEETAQAILRMLKADEERFKRHETSNLDTTSSIPPT
jgi:hypothetical protein